MEEINIKDLLYYFKKNCFIIIELVLLSIIVAEVYIGFIQKPKFKSYTTILVYNEQQQVSTGELTLNTQLVKTYSEIIKSRAVLGKVKQELNLNASIGEISQMISVSSVSDTQIIKVSVINGDNKKAKQIANALARIFSEEVKRIYKIDNVSVIDEAVVAKEPYNINNFKTLALSVFAGLFIGIAVVFVKYYFDDTIKTIDDVETCLNLPVIGIIPKQDYSKKERRGSFVRRISRKK